MKHTEITVHDNGQAYIDISDGKGRTLRLVLKGHGHDDIGVTFRDEHGAIDDWHIRYEDLYDLLWDAFLKDDSEVLPWA